MPLAADELHTSDGVALATTIAHVARAATRAQSPITFLQVPTSSPPRNASLVGGGGGEESSGETTTLDWQPARSHGVGSAVALPADVPPDRFDFFDDVATLASTSGGRLWIADHRGDRRGGIWLPVEAQTDSNYSDWARGLVEKPESTLTRVCPVTFVAPRTGRHDVRDCTVLVRESHSNCFGHRWVAEGPCVRPARYRIAEWTGEARRAEGNAREILAGLADLFRRNSSDPVLDKAADYSGYRGASARLVLEPPEKESRSVWAAWQLPFQDDALLVTLESLRQTLRFVLETNRPGALDPEVLIAKTNIEYIVCQRVETGELKGRCKLAVPRGLRRASPARIVLVRCFVERSRSTGATTWRSDWIRRR